MAVTLKEVEAVPAAFPDAPAGLPAAAAALDPTALWQRIEAYCAARWTAREVVWTVEGEGDWTPPIAPAAVTTTEVWESGAWAAVTLPAGPYGYCLPGDGPYRITATVGGGDLPPAVSEAFRRLAEYLSDGTDRSGASSYRVNMGPIEEQYERSVAWVARAMDLSGAADLLRPWKRRM